MSDAAVRVSGEATVRLAELGTLEDTVDAESWAQAASARSGDPARFRKS